MMKCPICGNNARLYIKDNNLIYKCLNINCDKEVEKEVVENNISNISLREVRERIEKILSSSDKTILISNIKRIRIDLDLNQGEVSRALGVSAQRYGTMERCDNIPTVSKLMDICNIYNMTLNDLYSIVTVTEEQYRILNRLVAKQDKITEEEENVNVIVLEEDKTIEELENKIAAYEKETGITERKIFDNEKDKDSDELVVIKKKLKKMDRELSSYRKKKNAILKQKTVIDYYNWNLAKDIIGYK